MKKVDLDNFGFVQARLPKDVLTELQKECRNTSNKKEMISGLTKPGVAPHCYLQNENVFKGIQKIIDDMLDLYTRDYQPYLGNMGFLDKNLPIVFGKPWINYQKPHEYIPLHKHSGVFSYNVYVSLPEESVFEFHYLSTIGTSMCHRFNLTKEDIGVVTIFPSTLQHVVYPFQGKETRITVAGNLLFKT